MFAPSPLPPASLRRMGNLIEKEVTPERKLLHFKKLIEKYV